MSSDTETVFQTHQIMIKSRGDGSRLQRMRKPVFHYTDDNPNTFTVKRPTSKPTKVKRGRKPGRKRKSVSYSTSAVDKKTAARRSPNKSTNSSSRTPKRSVLEQHSQSTTKAQAKHSKHGSNSLQIAASSKQPPPPAQVEGCTSFNEKPPASVKQEQNATGVDDDISDRIQTEESEVNLAEKEPTFTATATAITDDASSSQNNDEVAQTIEALAQWLATRVIGGHAVMVEMKAYADHLFDLGIHSAELAQRLCTAEDIKSFDWMKEFHKRAFLAWRSLNEN